eukprot:TRINITY_DN808_c2_g1_i1.p1 TRINITY_DN808_c2_g1~~TRINITY_DN808_c2_g1_i1.p1  ORF type:complete len:304 (+),score=65.75 TRINITY_DN808_c2_g1_i1:210-1121(+)
MFLRRLIIFQNRNICCFYSRKKTDNKVNDDKTKWITDSHNEFEPIKRTDDNKYINFIDGTKEKSPDSISVKIIPDFLSKEEQNEFMKELKSVLIRRRYETIHFDNVITNYKEMLYSKWKNKTVVKAIERARNVIFKKGTTLQTEHVLEITEKGKILPHVDSIKFSGGIVAGISLESPTVMTLQLDGGNSDINYDINYQREQARIEMLLKPGSLYILANDARYLYTHSILSTFDELENTTANSKESPFSFVDDDDEEEEDKSSSTHQLGYTNKLTGISNGYYIFKKKYYKRNKRISIIFRDELK